MPSQRKSAATPMVAIFWLIGNRLVFDTSTIDEAEVYGNHKTHALSHIECLSRPSERWAGA